MATRVNKTFSRREKQREETRQDLARAAFEQARARGLANVRVPEIAAAAGVSTRTFNNYFPSKEAAIVWPATRRAARLAANLLHCPDDVPLDVALVGAVTALYGSPAQDALPAGWLRDFRLLVSREPGLHGEYLKASDAAERALADALSDRAGKHSDELWPRVLAAMVVGAERAAVMHWIADRDRQEPLVETVRAAVEQAVAGLGSAR